MGQVLSSTVTSGTHIVFGNSQAEAEVEVASALLFSGSVFWVDVLGCFFGLGDR